jgi:dihydrofolate synthase/folylpolyglutamate synthase
VRRVLEREANERRSPLRFIELPLEGYPVALPGVHQRWNAALAVECLHAAGIRLDYGTLHHGLSTVRWPGRFEVLSHEGREVILDGAHNPQGAAVLVQTWREHYRERKAVLVFSAVAAKDVSGILALLVPLASKIHLCPVDTLRALPAEELAASLPAEAPPHECHASFDKAFAAALGDEGPILVAGSLFLIGEAKARLQGGVFQSSTQ